MHKKASLFSLYIYTGLFFLSPLSSAENKPHELWWEQHLVDDYHFDLFAGWLDGTNAVSRIAMREHIKKHKYTSILDVPCGLCVDFFGIQQNQIAIDYTGLDITPQLITKGQAMGVPCFLGSIERIPFPNNTFDIGYARHILEHLDYYQDALNELIRVSKKEVLVIFFIKPTAKITDDIRSDIHGNAVLYHNRYSRQKLELFLTQHKKVANIEWQEVNEQEIILHIYLN